MLEPWYDAFKKEAYMEQKRRRHGHEFWTSHIRGWEASGNGRMEYCREAGISYWSFRAWQKRLQEKSAPKNMLVRVPVKINSRPHAEINTIELLINGSIIIRIQPGFDGKLLRAVIHELGALQ